MIMKLPLLIPLENIKQNVLSRFSVFLCLFGQRAIALARCQILVLRQTQSGSTRRGLLKDKSVWW